MTINSHSINYFPDYEIILLNFELLINAATKYFELDLVGVNLKI